MLDIENLGLCVFKKTNLCHERCFTNTFNQFLSVLNWEKIMISFSKEAKQSTSKETVKSFIILLQTYSVK